MPLRPDAVNGRLDAGIEQFDNQNQQNRTGEQGGFDPTAAKPECRWQQDCRGQQFLPKGGFAPACRKAIEGVPRGMPDTGEAGAVFLRVDRRVGGRRPRCLVHRTIVAQPMPLDQPPRLPDLAYRFDLGAWTSRVPARASCQNCRSG